MNNTKSGVTLISLVVSIVIIVILIGATISSFKDSDMLNKTNAITEKTNVQIVEDLAKSAWSESYLKGKTTQYELEQAVLKRLTDNNVDIMNYDIMVTEDDVIVNLKGKIWRMIIITFNNKVTSVKVTNGEQTIDVGTTINYLPEGAGSTKYKGGWKIMGADDKGRLLILSNESVTETSALLSGKEGYINAEKFLDDMVNNYIDGIIGVEARSIKVEDIDMLTAFNKNIYGKDTMGHYGLEITYKWQQALEGKEADYKPLYSYVYNGKTITGQMTEDHGAGFSYYDENTDSTTISEYIPGKVITTIRNNYYTYSGEDYLSETTKAYKMIFRNTLDTDTANAYWLSSNCICNYANNVSFGVYCVSNGKIDSYQLLSSKGENFNVSYGVRAVVTLADNINIRVNSSGIVDII